MDERTRVRRSPRRLIKGILFLIVTCGLVALLVYSPIFTLQKLNVKGAVYLSEDEIAYIARVQKGQPLFNLETAEVTENLLKDLRIESATVKRNLPYSLDINIVERVPVATVASEYGYVDLDRQGKVIAAYRNLRHVPIPLITGVTVHDLYIGDDVRDANIRKVLSLLQELGRRGFHRAVDTTLYAAPETVEAVAGACELFLVDLKSMDTDTHKRYTGVPNGPILNNLRKIASLGKPYWIRIPFIAEVNASEANLRATADFLCSLDHRPEVLDLLPYHDIGKGKHERMGTTYNPESLPMSAPSADLLNRSVALLSAAGLHVRIGG